MIKNFPHNIQTVIINIRLLLIGLVVYTLSTLIISTIISNIVPSYNCIKI